MWNQVNAVLEEAQTILAELQSYTGAGLEIREVGLDRLCLLRLARKARKQGRL